MELCTNIRGEEDVMQEYLQVQLKYKDLLWIPVSQGYCIEGNLSVDASFNDVRLPVNYDVRIIIPENYPIHLPMSYEIGGKINSSFHHYKQDSLCLGIVANLYKMFRRNQNLFFYIDELLVNYLYSH